MTTVERGEGPSALEIRDLKVSLASGRSRRPILAGVSLNIAPRETVGLVGESGSGKSTTGRAVLRLFPRGAEVSGTLELAGFSVMDLSGRALREFRSRQVGMIYQDPRSRINPLRKVGDFITEALRDRGVSRADADERAITLLEAVSVPDAPRRMRQYPGELSGGLLQRVMIASVLVAEPSLMVADEPTSALDVTTQEEVVAIMAHACRERKMALLFITHDLDLAAAVSDRIAVMYAGLVLELVPSERLHSGSRHPYTVALLRSRPSLLSRQRIQAIPGTPMAAYESGEGCVFATRCPLAMDRCVRERPSLRTVDGSEVACHRAEEVEAMLAGSGSV